MFKRTTQLLIATLLMGFFLTTTYTQEASQPSNNLDSGSVPTQNQVQAQTNDDNVDDAPADAIDNDNEEDDDANEDALNQPWTCNHDQEEKPEPEIADIADVDEEGVKDAQEGRVLASYPKFRIYGYYGYLSSAKSYLSERLLPPILSYFENALNVKYPVRGPLRINSGSICGKATPSVLRSGVNADFIYMFTSQAAAGTWVASTLSCQLAPSTRRPLVGMTTVNTNLFRATTDPLLHEKNMYAIMHELIHTLGFSSSLFPQFIDNNARPLRGHITKTTLDGLSTTVVNVAPLTQRLRDHFGCSSLRGAYLENNGQYGAVAGSHFERRHFGFEAMTAYLIYEMKLSQFTLAMLEGSGWYVPNYEYADGFWWGQGQGCSFLTGSCSSVNRQFSEFCTSGSRSCSVPGRGAGSCSGDQVSGSCRFIHPSVSYDCSSSYAANYARLPNIQTFGRGKGSKCFEGTLGGSSQTTFCFKYTCSGSGGNTQLNVQLGNKSVACNREGYVSVAGYKGSLKCPDPQTFCKTVGQKTCPRNCMGRGKCVNGYCQCYQGFKGEDCAY